MQKNQEVANDPLLPSDGHGGTVAPNLEALATQSSVPEWARRYLVTLPLINCKGRWTSTGGSDLYHGNDTPTVDFFLHGGTKK